MAKSSHAGSAGQKRRRNLSPRSLLLASVAALVLFTLLLFSCSSFFEFVDGGDDEGNRSGNNAEVVRDHPRKTPKGEMVGVVRQNDETEVVRKKLLNSHDDEPQIKSSQHHAAARIVHITVQTGQTATWCRMLLSFFLSQPQDDKEKDGHQPAFLASSLNSQQQQLNSDFSPATIHNIGWGKKYSHTARPAWILEWIREQQQKKEEDKPLSDEDILFFADGGDTLYTGVPSDDIAKLFDALAVRRNEVDETTGDIKIHSVGGGGDASGKTSVVKKSLPALLFNAEANCYHQQTFSGSWGPKKGRCLSTYRRFHARVRAKNERKKREMQQQMMAAGGGEGEADFIIPSNVEHLSTCTSVGGDGEGLSSSSLSASPPKFKYLNAGAWIGRVWAVKKVFAQVKSVIDEGRGKWWCDQSVIGSILLKQTFSEWILGIDTENKFFLPIYHLDERKDFCPERFDNAEKKIKVAGENGDDQFKGREKAAAALVTFGQKPRLLTMCHSNSTPSLLHFNGKSEKMARFLTHRTTWWQQQHRLKEAGDSSAASVLDRNVNSQVVFLGNMRDYVKSQCPNPQLPP